MALLRHGIAEDPSDEKSDEDRSLTPEGHARMKQVARGLERVLPRVQTIYTSPLLRAVQTSLWVSRGYRSRVTVTTSDALRPEAPVGELLALIESIQVRRAVIVGHEPNLVGCLNALTGLGSLAFELRKGGCVGLRIEPGGSVLIEWVLPPRVLRKLAE